MLSESPKSDTTRADETIELILNAYIAYIYQHNKHIWNDFSFIFVVDDECDIERLT